MVKETKRNLITILANERTFLAYVRTALTLFVAGVSFIRFFEIDLVVKLGAIFVVIGVVVSFIGAIRYFAIRNRIGNGG
jgi:putative membrane protein